MLFHPVIIALLLASTGDALLVLAASVFAVQVLRHWDLASGAQRQLDMERRTYLVSTLLALVLATEALTLLLFVHNAERMSVMFVGAMCAVGTLNVNAWGFPALIAKIVVFFLAAAWLVLNHTDQRAHDYPLTRVKYALLLVAAPVMAAAAIIQALYFLGLRADVITSCCGSLFSPEAPGVTADLAGLPPREAMFGFYATLALTLAAGVHVWRGGRGALLYAGASVTMFAVALAAVVSFISLYIYEHPHHHCPFCLLQAEYGYIGYALYLPLFAGTAAGIGAGLIQPWAATPSLKRIAPPAVRRLALLSTLSFGLFALAATGAMLSSKLVLVGS